jgi:hypothetical protein
LLAVNARRFLGSTGTFVLSGFFLLKGVLTLIVVRGTPARSDA